MKELKKELKEVIEMVHQIDNALDAYEYKNYTYEEYCEAISKNIPGNGSLRNMYRNGVHVWNNVSIDALKTTKTTINNIYRNIYNKEEIQIAINKLHNTLKNFKKMTDNYSIYPIQSEMISSNISEIIKYFNSLV